MTFPLHVDDRLLRSIRTPSDAGQMCDDRTTRLDMTIQCAGGDGLRGCDPDRETATRPWPVPHVVRP